MTKALSQRERFLRRQARSFRDWLRNAPLFLLTGLVALAIEVFAAGGIFATNHAAVSIGPFQVHLAWAEAIMSASMTLVSLVLAGAAAAQKADPRQSQQRRAWRSQFLAICCLAAPVFYASSCLALNTQTAEADAFRGSAAERADLAIVADPQADSVVKQNAADDLQRGMRPAHPDLAHLLPAMMWISFLLFGNMMAVRAGWRAKPVAKRSRKRSPRTNNVVRFKSA